MLAYDRHIATAPSQPRRVGCGILDADKMCGHFVVAETLSFFCALPWFLGLLGGKNENVTRKDVCLLLKKQSSNNTRYAMRFSAPRRNLGNHSSWLPNLGRHR